MPPIVSVITITHRDYPMPVQAAALAAQSFKDFEWILVDELHPAREQTVAEIAAFHGLTVRYVPPYRRVPYVGYAAALNTGVLYASGQVGYFLFDYCVPAPWALERHQAIHQALGPKTLVSGRSFLPKPGWTGDPNWAPNWEGEMVWQHDGLDRWQYLSHDAVFPGPVFRGMVYDAWWAGRDDSAPLDVIRALGGFEELFDGGHGFQDSELSMRVHAVGGWHVFDTVSCVMELPLHGVGRRPLLRNDRAQVQLAMLLRDLRRWTGHYRAIGPEIDLRKVCWGTPETPTTCADARREARAEMVAKEVARRNGELLNAAAAGEAPGTMAGEIVRQFSAASGDGDGAAA